MAKRRGKDRTPLSDEQRARISKVAREIQSVFSLDRVLCGVLDGSGHIHFVGDPADRRALPESVALSEIPEAAHALAGGSAELTSPESEAIFGRADGAILHWRSPDVGKGVCVVFDEKIPAAASSGSLAAMGERLSASMRLADEAQDLRRRVRDLGQTANAFRVLVENTSDPVKILDLDGRVRAWNPACERLYGWSAREALGQVLPHVPPRHRPGVIASLRRAASTDGVVERDVNVALKDGSLLVLTVALLQLTDSDGLPVGVLSIVRSVDADSRLGRLQDEFVSLVSAELKNPLTAIMGYSQLLGRGEIAEDPVKRARTVRALEARVQQMAALVDDLLIASRIDQGALRLERAPTDLAAVVTETVSRFEQFQPHHRFVIDVDTRMASAYVDPRRIEQALTNLLSNAVKYSPDADEILVSLLRDDTQAVVSVTDEGTGIPAEAQDRVFDRFYRVEGEVGPGAGLGLYLVKMIAEAHGGSVALVSAPGSGSTFEMRLPMAMPAGADTA